MSDLISRHALLKRFGTDPYFSIVPSDRRIFEVVNSAPAVDAEVVRHEGNTTFITTDNLDAYADRVIIRQGNWCKVYYRDSDDAEVEG